MPRTKPTIDDVAALSGVARVTVSRVLNSGPNVREEVRARVLKAVDKLQYKVNPQARFLAGGKTRVLALVYASDINTEPNSFYHSGLELGALRACSDHSFQLLTHTVNQYSSSKAQNILELIDQRRCDGLVLTPPFSDDLQLIEALNKRDFPFVAIAPGREARLTTSGVGIDDEVAGYEITSYLLSIGHRRFGFIKGLAGHLSAEERFAGFLRALKDYGLDESAYVAERGNFTFKSGTDLSAVLLSASTRPTALICANDDMAVGALFTAHKIGLQIPDDLSVVGFDDTPVSEIIWPPLTTVRQPLKTLGYRALEMMLERVNATVKMTNKVYETIPHTLILRQSSTSKL